MSSLHNSVVTRPCQDYVLALRTKGNVLFAIFLSSECTGLWKRALSVFAISLRSTHPASFNSIG